MPNTSTELKLGQTKINDLLLVVDENCVEVPTYNFFVSFFRKLLKLQNKPIPSIIVTETLVVVHPKILSLVKKEFNKVGISLSEAK